MASASSSDVSDGPVLSVINKRLRALRKKQNRIIQMEESIAQGKPINKEQEDVLRSKSAVAALIDELEKLRQPLNAALHEEINHVLQRHQESAPRSTESDDSEEARVCEVQIEAESDGRIVDIEDLLNLLYFANLFDVKPQSEYTSAILTRTHERGCCLTYDYVTDEATDLLREADLDLISILGGLLISRPMDSTLSHKNALQRCIDHAKLWLGKSDQIIAPETSITYASLRERLIKIMASDYFTITPEMKAPVDVAAAAGNYSSFQVPVDVCEESLVVPEQTEELDAQYQQNDGEATDLQEFASGESSPVDEPDKDDNSPEDSVQQKPPNEAEQDLKPEGSTEQQYYQRRYDNQRGGRGGRRGYSNGRGGRGGPFGRGGGGIYQNGRIQHYEQPGNYYGRSYYGRGRGGGGGRNGNFYHHNGGPAVQPRQKPANVALAS